MSTAVKYIRHECERCGEHIDLEEGDEPDRSDSGSVVCYSCWHDEHYFECAICGEDDDLEHEGAIGELFVVTEELGDFKPGIYEILSHPFYTQSIVGAGWLHEWAVRFVTRDIPPKLDLSAPCGFVCQTCRKQRYAKQVRAARKIAKKANAR